MNRFFSIAFSAAVAALCTLGSSCKEECVQPQPGHTALTLQSTFISTRWCRLQWNNDSNAVSQYYVLLRNGRDTVFAGTVPDTVRVKIMQDMSLKPATGYSYSLFRIYEDKHWDSATVTVQTLDTSRGTYNWETIRIGRSGSYIKGIWGSSPRSIWMCGKIDTNGGTTTAIAHYLDGVFNYFPLKVVGDYNHCFGTSDSSVYFVYDVVLTHYDGHQFDYHIFDGDSLPDLRPADFRSVWVTPNDREVFVVGTNGTIVHRKPDYTWEVQQSGTMLNLINIIGFSANDVYAVGAQSNFEGIILHYNGSIWTEIGHGYLPPPADSTLLVGSIVAIGGESPDSLYAVGQRIFKRTGPASWNLADCPGNFRENVSNLYYMEGVAGTWNNMWIVGDFGFVLHYNGEYWNSDYPFLRYPSSKVFVRVLPFPNEVFIVGSDDQGGLLIHGR